MYVCRNPKDTAVSTYKFFAQTRPEMQADFEEFAKLFKDNVYTYGSYFSHLKVNFALNI